MIRLANRLLRWADAHVFYAAFCWSNSHRAPRWIVRLAIVSGVEPLLYRLAEFRLKETDASKQ